MIYDEYSESLCIYWTATLCATDMKC